MSLPPKILLNTDHRFCGMELEHSKRFLALSRHITAVSTIALIVAIVGVTSLLPHATLRTLYSQNNIIK
jgi:hypothetical protein